MLRGLLKKHFEYTKSPKAGAVLANWDLYEKSFLKVCSPKYSELTL